MTDREFEGYISSMARGDRGALKTIYNEYLKLIFSVIYDTIGQREEAEDITSEFFIKLYSIAGSYRPGSGHKRWLVTIAKNMAVDRIRKIDRECLTSDVPDGVQAGDMEERLIKSITLKQAMETLKPDEREILDLKVLGEFTFKEISEMMNRPIGTVSWIYHQAISKLRRCRL